MMILWIRWCEAILLLRPAFSRKQSFQWFATIVAGLTVRDDLLGLTSIVRGLKLKPKLYRSLLDACHSSGVKLPELTRLWTQAALKLFLNPVRVNGRLVLLGDGLKNPKRGRKMPAVKLLHQQSESNTKPEYVMAHSMQAVCLLVEAAKTCFAVPLTARIHEGIVFSNADQRTLLDKMLSLVGSVCLGQSFYLVADAYYASGKIIKGLLTQGNHLVTRMRLNSVAYLPPVYKDGKKRSRGRPAKYGKKIGLRSLLNKPSSMQQAVSPVYGESDKKSKIIIRYRTCDLMWRPAGCLVRFVAVRHPTRGECILACTDTSLDALEIIRLYGLRFKIEYSFKQSLRTLGAFGYHFWMRDMTPIRRRSGNQYLHHETPEYREAVLRKIHAYHVFVQAGLVCQGLLQYLSATFGAEVWRSFDSWLRTVRPGIPPSEFVVTHALRRTIPEFLMDHAKTNFLAKFLAERQDTRKFGHFSMAA
jgi:DDE superfamily endonuclease